MPKKKETEPLDDEDKNELNSSITFIPKKCPKCGELLAIRKLGVWGYYCIDCMFWWGTYDPYPKVKKK
jgi:hypothetical protein